MVPDNLYKYRSVTSDDDLKYALETITKGSIFFGHSFSFNDIFDCRPAVVWDCTDEQYIYYAVKRLKKSVPYGKRFDETTTVRRIRARFGTNEDPRTPEGRKIAQQQFAVQISQFGVFCAASRGNNLLMWSHYASSCAGVCFELSTAGNEWQRVQYSSKRPRLNLSLGVELGEAVDQSLLVKSDDWAYEEEWRLIGNRGVNTMPPGMLRRVIFGANCALEKREIIRQAIVDSGVQVTIAEAVASIDSFDFDILPLDLLSPIIGSH